MRRYWWKGDCHTGHMHTAYHAAWTQRVSTGKDIHTYIHHPAYCETCDLWCEDTDCIEAHDSYKTQPTRDARCALLTVN